MGRGLVLCTFYTCLRSTGCGVEGLNIEMGLKTEVEISAPFRAPLRRPHFNHYSELIFRMCENLTGLSGRGWGSGPLDSPGQIRPWFFGKQTYGTVFHCKVQFTKV